MMEVRVEFGDSGISSYRELSQNENERLDNG
jgi:hypothetical protein